MPTEPTSSSGAARRQSACGTSGITNSTTRGHHGAGSADAETEESVHDRSLYRLVRMMCDNVPDLIWAKDMQKRYLFANRALCETLLHAVDTEEPLGKTDLFFAQRERAARPDDPDWHTFGEICSDSDHVVMTSQKAQRFDEFGNVRGEPLYLDVYKAPFLDEDGQLMGTVGCARVVTHERQLEEEHVRTADALLESQQMLRLVLDAIPVRVFWKDIDGNYVGCNRPFAADAGLPSPRDIIGRNDHELGWAAQAELYRADDRHVIRSGVPKLNYEEPQTTPEGGQIWLRTSKMPLRDSSGRIRGVLGTYEDITEAKRRHAVEHALYRISKAVHSVHDLDQLFHSIRQTLGELMPVDNMYVALYDEERNALSFPFFVDQEMAAPASKALGKGLTEYVLRTGEPLLATPDVFEELLRKGDIESIGAPSIDWLGVPLKTGGHVIGVLAVQTYVPAVRYDDRDRQVLSFVSDEVATAIARKRHEEEQVLTIDRIRGQQAAVVELATSDRVASGDFAAAAAVFAEMGARTLQVARVGVWLGNEEEGLQCIDLYDLESGSHGCGTILEASKYPRYLAALSADRVIVATDVTADPRTVEFRDWYSSDAGIGAILDAPIRMSGRLCGVVRFEHVGASRKWLPDEVRFAGEVADQTGQTLANAERRRAQEERRALELQVQHTQKLESLGVLAGGIAHDFNNILTAIIGHADLAMLRLPTGSPAGEDITQVLMAARRAADISRQLLAYSGKGQFVTELIDVRQVVEEMGSMLQVSITKKASLGFSFAPELPKILADPGQIRQVLMNLIMNASEALGTSEGVITLGTGVVHCDRHYLANAWNGADLLEGDYVFVEVTDTGHGMDAATQQRIFDPFFTTKFTGRGLGLAAVLGIVRGHKGAVMVESQPGKGSTFRVLLPPVRDAREQPMPASHLGEVRGSGLVLLVDDEDAVRTVAKEMLEILGYSVLAAADGQEALHMARERRGDIACILLDLTMPRMDGVDAFRELCQVSPEVPVILTSGYSEMEATERFGGSGLAGFIQKPYRVSTLGERIRLALRERGG